MTFQTCVARRGWQSINHKAGGSMWHFIKNHGFGVVYDFLKGIRTRFTHTDISSKRCCIPSIALRGEASEIFTMMRTALR